MTGPTSHGRQAAGRRRSARILTLVLALGGSGCGTSSARPGVDPFSGGGGQTQIRVRVQNQNFYDANLTAISDTGNRRLGTVTGNQTATFSMPMEFSTGLRIQIDLLAGPTCTTDVITANPGETVDLVIPSDLDRTRYCG